MRKFQIIASSDIQIEGLPETAKGGDVLGHLETDCNVGSIWSCLKFGQAVLVPVEEAKPSKPRSRTSSKPTGDEPSEGDQVAASDEAAEPTADATAVAEATRPSGSRSASKTKPTASSK